MPACPGVCCASPSALTSEGAPYPRLAVDRPVVFLSASRPLRLRSGPPAIRNASRTRRGTPRPVCSQPAQRHSPVLIPGPQRIRLGSMDRRRFACSSRRATAAVLLFEAWGSRPPLAVVKYGDFGAIGLGAKKEMLPACPGELHVWCCATLPLQNSPPASFGGVGRRRMPEEECVGRSGSRNRETPTGKPWASSACDPSQTRRSAIPAATCLHDMPPPPPRRRST